MDPANTILLTSAGFSPWSSGFSALHPKWFWVGGTSYAPCICPPAPAGVPAASQPPGSALRATAPAASCATLWWTCGSPGCGKVRENCPCERRLRPGPSAPTRFCWGPRRPLARRAATRGSGRGARRPRSPPESRRPRRPAGGWNSRWAAETWRLLLCFPLPLLSPVSRSLSPPRRFFLPCAEAVQDTQKNKAIPKLPNQSSDQPWGEKKHPANTAEEERCYAKDRLPHPQAWQTWQAKGWRCEEIKAGAAAYFQGRLGLKVRKN